MCKDGCCGSHHGELQGHGHGYRYRRRFLTEAEKAARLKNYAAELKKELTAVEERIKELEG